MFLYKKRAPFLQVNYLIKSPPSTTKTNNDVPIESTKLASLKFKLQVMWIYIWAKWAAAEGFIAKRVYLFDSQLGQNILQPQLTGLL